MKERVFKVPESVVKTLKTMSNRKAGKLFKAVCDYVFNDVVYEGRDRLVRSHFVMMKRVVDCQRMNSENGKLGAKKSLELYQKRQEEDAAKNATIDLDIVGSIGEFLSKLDESEKK